MTIDIEKLTAQVFEIARFGIVGLAATFTHLGVAYGLTLITDISLILVNIAAFCVAFVVSFLGHYHWTFRAAGPKHESLIRFFAIAVSGLIASTLVLSLLIHFDIANDFLKLAISIFIIPAVTYFLSKSWAFKAPEGFKS